MKWFIYVLVIVCIIVIQQSLYNTFPLGLYAPDILLLVALAIVWATNNFDFLIFAVLGGFWTEINYGLPVGTVILSLIVYGSIAYLVIHRWLFSDKSWLHFFGAVAVGTIFINVWSWIYISILHTFNWSSTSISFGLFVRSLLPALIVNLLLTYPIFVMIELLVKYIQKLSRPSVIKI